MLTTISGTVGGQLRQVSLYKKPVIFGNKGSGVMSVIGQLFQLQVE